MKEERSALSLSNTSHFGVWLFFLDFTFFNISYFLCNFIKRGTFALSTEYINFLGLFYICWLVSSLIGRKFEKTSYSSHQSSLVCFVKCTLYLSYCIAFAIVIIGVTRVSRVQVFSTCFVLFIFEYLAFTIYNFSRKNNRQDTHSKNITQKSDTAEKAKLSATLFGMDFLLIVLAFVTANYMKRGHIYLLPQYEQLFLVIIGLWFAVSLVTNKFVSSTNKNYTLSVSQWLKAGIIMLAIISILVFGLRLFHFSRFQSFGTILLLLLFEIVYLKLYFLINKNKLIDDDIESIDKVKEILEQDKIVQSIDIEDLRVKLLEPVRDRLKKILLKESNLFNFIDENIDLNKILCLEATAENSRQFFSLTEDEIPVRLMLNLDKINNIRRINRYFLDVHQMLVPGGYFVGRSHTISTHREYIYNKYPRYIVRSVYISDFLLHRVIPKLPFLNKLYFAITQGKNRVLSRAEILGRLHFCGFEIVAEKNIGNYLTVVAKKAKVPSLNITPTYGPFVELKRVGYNNEIIRVYKFRTMHPYSEYLQNYVFKIAGLKKGGKLEDDFRLTGWGRLMRRLWIDELPMLYNWVRGDLQLVGVRPLSLQYFNLYDRELQAMRATIKPGLIPPFYADLPETFEEICDSEKRFIQSFMQNPIKTQFIYFWKAFNNIVFKGARSR